jgi:limonene-1,2-epoxide hydrolase
MAASFTPRLLHDAAVRPTEPVAVVEAFLAALAAGDFRDAEDLLDERVRWVNVGLPAISGRRRVIALLEPLGRPGARFEVYLHGAAASGSTVLTDRTDVLAFGPLRLQFWVAGRFEVRDGRITLWRDAFDYLDLTRALLRGVAGAVLPALRPSAPASPDVQPGRH